MAAAIVVGVLLLLALLAEGIAPPAARGDTPTASPQAGDVRTSPSAPGLVGDPLFAVVGVAIVAGAAVGVTLLYLRITQDR